MIIRLQPYGMKPSVFKFKFVFLTVAVFRLGLLCSVHMHVNIAPVLDHYVLNGTHVYA